MKKPVPLALLALLLLGAAKAFPQVSFVSRLQARAADSGVQLSWRPVQGFHGSYRIYRHTQEILESSFPGAAEVAVVAAQVSSYEDHPPAPGSYYYAVLLDDGRLSRLFIDFRNKTSTPVRVTPPEQRQPASVTGLSAERTGDSVRLRFQASPADRELLLFRALAPIRSTGDLDTTPLALEPGTKQYEDFPIPGLDFYYAVVDAGAFRLGRAELVPGQNATLQPVQVPLGSGRVGLPPTVLAEVAPAGPAAGPAGPAPAAQSAAPGRTAAPDMRQPSAGPASEQIALVRPTPPAAAPLRSAPLPYLDLDAARGLPPPSLPPPRPLGPVARSAMEAVMREAPRVPAPRLRAQALPEEMSAGEEGGLRAVVVDQLLAGQLPEAEKRLQAFLAERRDAEQSARARFYLGQVYYLQGKLDSAVLELLLARPLYYSAVQPWLENCLQNLRLAGG